MHFMYDCVKMFEFIPKLAEYCDCGHLGCDRSLVDKVYLPTRLQYHI